MTKFSSKDIIRLMELLNDELNKQSFKGEIYLVGGAVMCLVFQARASTRDVDAYFQPTQKLRQAAAKVASKVGIKDDWLNDAVKGYLSQQGSFNQFLELSHLRVFAASADYLLAMKCLAMRIGEEFYDLEDVRYLIRYLNISKYQQAIEIITRYYPLERFPQKTLYALEELFQKNVIKF